MKYWYLIVMIVLAVSCKNVREEQKEVRSEKVFPEIVDTRDSGYKAVDYQKLSAVLIEAVKELKTEIEELKDKCNGCTC